MPQDLEGILFTGGSISTVSIFSSISLYIQIFPKILIIQRLDLDLIANLVRAIKSHFYLFRTISLESQIHLELSLMHAEMILEIYITILFMNDLLFSHHHQKPKEIRMTGL